MSRIDLIKMFGNEDAKTFNKCSKAYEQGRADREKELAELPNEYSEKLWRLAYSRGKTDAITECLRIVQKIKDDYNEARFGEQVPINYETLCGIIIAFEQIKDKKGGTENEM